MSHLSNAASNSGDINGRTRAAALSSMRHETLDVLVVGGGVVGVGTALDAATRGLRVGLVEVRDIASGTSSRSSKLIHGGLRYLEQFNFSLVREALRERGRLLSTIAPHLVTPVPFLYPLRHRYWERFYVGSGVALYDAMAWTNASAARLPRHRHLSRRQALERFASLRTDSLTGAIVYFDAQVDDARFALDVVRTAAAYGAHVATRTRLVDFLFESNTVVGARLVDLESPESPSFDVRARHVINATGVWSDDVGTLATRRAQVNVRASKGIHLVVSRDCIDANTGLIVRTDKSVLLIIPWGQQWIIGTTDTDWNLSKDNPGATAEDVDYLLREVNSVLARPLRLEDVVSVYVGLRPLAAETADSSADVSREHVISSPMRGLTVVTGGKYTTYRVMAEDAVDAAIRTSGLGAGASVTSTTPLLGATRCREIARRREELAHQYQLDVTVIDRLVGRYGDQLEAVLRPTRERPDALGALRGAPGYLRAEVLFALEAEVALHLEDVLVRRTRISIETRDRGTAAALEVATMMKEALGWDQGRTQREVDNYLDLVAVEREAQDQPDDEQSDQVMRRHHEIVPE